MSHHVYFIQTEDDKALHSFFLSANPDKPKTIPAARQFARLCMEQGCEVMLDEWLHQKLALGRPRPLEDLPDNLTALVSFGGDGTLLRAIPHAAARDIPILGVNLGHTGFLMELSPDKMPEALGMILRGEYGIFERAMLDIEINGQHHHLAMNEFVLTRGINPSSLVLDVMHNDELVYTIHGDGVLVSTPTGTTGYVLSAGGPVIAPSVPCHAVVPVCTHIMHQRPVILPDTGTIYVRARAGKGSKAHQICIDGQVVYNLEEGSVSTIKKADKPARFIRFTAQRFLTRLHQKQMEWSNNVYGGNV